MKAVVITVVAGFALVAGTASASAEGLYAGGQIGFGGGDGAETLENGTGIGGFIGKHLGNKVRIEGEFAHRQNDMDTPGTFPVSGEMSSLALMGNAFYGFGDGVGFTPYLGVGIGFASVTMDSFSLSTDDTAAAFAAQFMIGASFPLGESLSMTVEARSFGAEPTFTNSSGFSFGQSYFVRSVMLGLRKNF